MAEVDLDRLAAAYDHRPERGIARRIAPAVAASTPGPGDLVLDVGGGRGGHSEAIAAATGATVVLLDPSEGMARSAAARGIHVVRARGEWLPIDDRAAALVYFHLSIHHGDWRRMLAEAGRVARDGGVIWVWTMDPEYHRASHLAQWFPRVGEIDAARFPAIDELAADMRSIGPVPAIVTEVQTVTRSAGSWIEAVRAGYVSTLHLLTGDEIEEGLAAFTAAHPDPDETIEYELVLTGVSSTRASVES